MMNEEKQKALEAALGQIEKHYGKGSVMKNGVRMLMFLFRLTALRFIFQKMRRKSRFKKKLCSTTGTEIITTI